MLYERETSSALRSLVSILLIAGALSISPLYAQAPPELGKELPWFVKETPHGSFPEILAGSDWMARHLKSSGVVAMDVRPLSVYEAGHLPGAIHFDVRRELTGESKTVVLYGGEQDRPAIGQAFLTLTGWGWRDIKVLAVDFEAWSRSSLPIERGRPKRGSSSSFAARPAHGEAPFVTREELLASFGRNGYEVLDLRGGWGAKYTAPSRFAAGHVPHALPFDIQTLLPATGWPDPEQARGVLLALGVRASDHVDPDATFLLYGEDPSDPTPGLGYLLLRMLGFAGRVFSPGFAGWAENANDPIVRIVDAEEVRGLLSREQNRERPEAGVKDELPKSFILLDLREDWDYDEDHIPGALSLPEHLFAERFDSVLREHWPKVDPATTPLVLYCYGRECTRSRNCATLAAQKGFRKLLWLREGMSGWAGIGQGTDGP